MKQLFAYIRVSTAKQGQGVSLQEQRAAIERYAERTGAAIIQWFEEKKTAAKTGRPEFARMMKLLKAGKSAGVIIHKIDRSTRNYRDWADIDELIESGIDVHFANDDLDLRSRGGRLAADIQVVVAVDYIRNLREEALKGIHGRLKQGVLPHPAPIGYLDCGAGKAKEIDPVKGPLVRKLFELYACGGYSLRNLTVDAEHLGLRNRNGSSLRLTQLQKLLRNPFYSGIIRSKRHGLFQGAHEPLVPPALFDHVQALLDGKFMRRTKTYAFPFRRMLRCVTCGRSLVGSERKGFVYYRCQTVTCPTTSLREDVIDQAFADAFARITLSEDEVAYLERQLDANSADEGRLRESQREALQRALSALDGRSSRLTDLLIEGIIDAEAHREKRDTLVVERQRIEARLSELGTADEALHERTRKILGLLKCAENLYKSADPDEKRELLQIVVSDCTVIGKTIEFSMREPFATIAQRRYQQQCGPDWYTPRTTSPENLLKLIARLSLQTPYLLDHLSV